MWTSSILSFLLETSLVTGLFFHNKVCYDGIDCFETNHPFDNSLGELPDSPGDIKIACFLWTRSNPAVPQVIEYSDADTIAQSNFDATRPTKILIHGFMSSKDESPVVANLSVALIKQDDYNVIGVDWSQGAKKLYPKAVANTRVVGAVLAQLVSTLQNKFSLKLADLHVIGHSLGAHTAGYVGRRVPGIARITGLDPAGPMFTKTEPAVRLDATDALFVDAIHSDAAPLQDADLNDDVYVTCYCYKLQGFGTLLPLGHQDFYPNGGQYQPGCPPPIKTTVEQLLTGQFADAFNSVSCGHDRAIWYFIESVLASDCRFKSYPCPSWSDFQAKNCTSCGGLPCPNMGLAASSSRRQGSFYLATNPQSPYCKTSH